MINNILSLLIWVPIFSGLAILFYNKKENYLNAYNIFINFFILILSILLLINFDQKDSSFQFIEKRMDYFFKY